jgi:hypothetical protein
MREYLKKVESGQVYRHYKEDYLVYVTATSRYRNTDFRRLNTGQEKPVLLKPRSKFTHYFETEMVEVDPAEARVARQIDLALTQGYRWFLYHAYVAGMRSGEMVRVLVSPADQLRPEILDELDAYDPKEDGLLSEYRYAATSPHTSALPML